MAGKPLSRPPGTGLWLVIAPRHHWRTWRPLWLVTQGRLWRNSESLTPSPPGFTAMRVAGVASLAMGGLILGMVITFFTSGEHLVRACREDREHLIALRYGTVTPMVTNLDEVERVARERGLATTVYHAEGAPWSTTLQFTKDGERWFSTAPGYEPPGRRC